jgi:endonuclease YncB( thermonuclease family)
MKPKHAFILAFLITGLIASNYIIYQELTKLPPETAIIQRVIDGDTFTTQDGKTIRLLNINTPEKSENFYSEAKQFVQQYENKTIILEITGQDKYKRTLARAYTLDNIYINLEIMNQGLAKPLLVEDKETKIFNKALQQAINNQKGMWKHSPYHNCIKSTIDKINEKVLLQITCQDIQINDWTLTDESRKIYTITTNNKNLITLHSSIGNDNETDIYWNLKTNVWNNDRDTLFIFDNNNLLVHFNSYGY